ncbi:MAG TPA: prepilin-type N-terminal cleavage/methylation domain-containing protein [Candidatus Rifleibacterium sp.]|nr:prepilin-type N-terminal cleavage/methylation domain-containing protein [Candidatus Rifleibacterium sp.]HPT47448.1 prepilin-type N-terminal cleavage/methylation domain-containing protein [Candidatus Rifleibacterium sp.]
MRGWSLVEVMVAVAIIVIAFVPLVNLITSNAVSTVKTGNYAKASAILTKFLEEVKHVPIKKYQEDIPELMAGTQIEVPVKFYPDTLASLEELKKEKEFWLKTTMKASKNEYEQLVEIAISAEVQWHERGDKTAAAEPVRNLRDFALIFNPETKFQ